MYGSKYKNMYHKFFALEQRCESQHAKVTKLYNERLYAVKPDKKRIAMTIVEMERLNNVDLELFKPRQYNMKK